jgi:hypothetical protein
MLQEEEEEGRSTSRLQLANLRLPSVRSAEGPCHSFDRKGHLWRTRYRRQGRTFCSRLLLLGSCDGAVEETAHKSVSTTMRTPHHTEGYKRSTLTQIRAAVAADHMG